MKTISKLVTASILSMSLLTVMAGAAIAPALGIIKSHFSSASSIQMQFLISLPALFIIFSNFAFPYLCRLWKTKTMAIIGLVCYVVFGSVPFFIDNLFIILVFRALLGLSVGIIMPLSTGLISFYYAPEEQSRLMGLSAAMNQMGGVVATLLAGILASYSWNFAFLVYMLGLIAVLLIAIALPNDRLGSRSSDIDKEQISLFARIRKFHPSVIGMFLLMSLFFVFPSNFAIITHQTTALSTNQITLIMVALDVVAFFVGIAFSGLIGLFRRSVKYFAPVCFIIAYALFSVPSNSLIWIFFGCLFIGIATGVGVPYLNTIASMKGGKTAALTVMPLLSSSLYIGQFLSPIYISGLGSILFPNSLKAPYFFALIVALVYLLQVFTTRHFQVLPPEKK